MEPQSEAQGETPNEKFIRRGEGSVFVKVLTNRPTLQYAWVQRAWLAILFLGGLYLWGYFLDWGRGPLNYHDWVYISRPRLTFMREAMLRGELPLHLSAPATEGDITRRFLAIPDLILSPQILLLRWISVGRFVLAHFWLMYTLGFGGLLLLRRRFGLSLLAFTILFSLFSFNGNILAHVSVGHITWGGYFFICHFCMAYLRIIGGRG